MRLSMIKFSEGLNKSQYIDQQWDSDEHIWIIALFIALSFNMQSLLNQFGPDPCSEF